MTTIESVRAATARDAQAILEREAPLFNQIEAYIRQFSQAVESGDLGANPNQFLVPLEGRGSFLTACQLVDQKIRREVINAALKHRASAAAELTNQLEQLGIKVRGAPSLEDLAEQFRVAVSQAAKSLEIDSAGRSIEELAAEVRAAQKARATKE